MNSPASLLEVNSVRFGYKRNGFELSIEKLEISNGKIVGLIGPNGAGKTTLIRLLSGRLIPQQGTVRINGMSPSQAVESGLTACLLEDDPPFSRVPFFFWKKVAEQLRPATLKPDSSDGSIDSWAQERAASPFCRMSFGEQRLAAISLVFRGTVQLVLLDEPTKGLDPRQREAVWKRILELKESGITAFVSSHILGDLEAFADEVLLLRSGVLIGKSDISDVKQKTGYFIHFSGMAVLDQIKRFGEVKHQVDLERKGPLILFLKDESQLDQALKIMTANGARIEKIEREGRGLEKFYQSCSLVE